MLKDQLTTCSVEAVETTEACRQLPSRSGAIDGVAHRWRRQGGKVVRCRDQAADLPGRCRWPVLSMRKVVFAGKELTNAEPML